MFTKIIQNTDHQPPTGIRVNDFQLSEEKDITDIVVKKESSSGSKKQKRLDSKEEKSGMENYMTQQPTMVKKDFQEFAEEELLPYSIHSRAEGVEWIPKNGMKIQKVKTESIPKPKNQLYKQTTNTSMAMSYKDLRRSTYLGALDLLNI